MPQQDDAPGEGDVATAIVPVGEALPVGLRAFRKREFTSKGDRAEFPRRAHGPDGSALAPHQKVGSEVIDDVGVRRRGQEAHARSRELLPHVERHHLGQCAVERGGELVAGNPGHSTGERNCQPEAKALALAQFAGGAEQEPRLTKTAGCESREALREWTAKCIDQRQIWQRQRGDIDRIELSSRGSEQG